MDFEGRFDAILARHLEDKPLEYCLSWETESDLVAICEASHDLSDKELMLFFADDWREMRDHYV